jgi:NAD-dependent dihydropyrimidine dehydrogenase PreA subunit/flavodoxin
MQTEIYFFTGTGNSLWVAMQIAEQLGDTKLISIPKIINQKTITVSDKVGIVCPIYMYNLPLIVADFIKKMTAPKYFFFIYAGGGEPGGGMKAVKKLCESRQIELSAIFNIKMPSNYTPYGATPEDKQQEYFNGAKEKIPEITRVIKTGEKYVAQSGTFFLKSYVFPGLLYQLGYKMIPAMAKSYVADEKCNGCGICEKVCPVGNIRLVDEKPIWDVRCQQCYACLQWCPQEAIQFGKKTTKIKRYRNPFIKIKEIIAANGLTAAEN